jgi:enoyl-CoA hydratase
MAEGVATVRLTDPEHRNALSPPMSLAIEAAVHEVVGGAARAIVVTAEPPVFSAGGSLDSLLSREVPLTEVYRGFVALAECPLPTVAAVGGPAVGAGINLALSCDVVITSPSAVFDARFLDVGIHPGGGHLFRLSSRVGAQGAAAMVVFGDRLDGEEAARRGLAWRCVPDAELEEFALGLARRAAARPLELVTRTKSTLQASLRLDDPSTALALEQAAQEWSMRQPFFEQSVRRMQERIASRRRPPQGDSGGPT